MGTSWVTSRYHCKNVKKPNARILEKQNSYRCEHSAFWNAHLQISSNKGAFNHNSGSHWGSYISTNAYSQPHKAWPNNVLIARSLCLYIKSKILCSFHSLQSF